MKERGSVLSPRNVATLPWKLEVEFDDTLTCKLYSQLSFSKEDDKFVAPPTSPVESFKYAPLTKFRKYCPFIPPRDYNDSSPLHDNSNVVKSSPVELHACTRNSISPKKIATLDTQDSSITEHREKEKLEFIEGCCATKFYSKGSAISENGIVDANENKRSKVRRDSSLGRLSERNKGERERRYRRENAQGKGFNKFSLNNVVDKESKRCFDLQPGLRTKNKNSRNMLTEVDRIQLANRKTVDSSDVKRLAEPKLRKQLALLTNGSSDNFCFGDSTSESREKYTFLREKKPVLWNYKRVVRLRSTANLLDFSNRWMKESASSPVNVHQNLDSSRISEKKVSDNS